MPEICLAFFYLENLEKNMVIGITGGIGSGKTTVSKIFEDSGHKVLRADDIAKMVMSEDAEVSRKIVDEFGKKCFSDGKLNTKILAEQVFNNPDKISKLNSIVHPPTIKHLEKKIANLNKNHSLLFVESALIFEAKKIDLFDHILLVTADEDIRIKRVLERDIETVSEIKSRILNQIPDEQKRGRCDFIIDNDSTLEVLKEKTLFFLNLFENLAYSK